MMPSASLPLSDPRVAPGRSTFTRRPHRDVALDGANHACVQFAMTETVVHIIEDDESLRLALDSLFRSVGLPTQLFGSAQEFLDAGQETAAGCLVLDVRLPGLSGLEFQEKLAASGNRMPIVLMTGHGDVPMSVRAMKAGAVDFLTKPFRDQDMLDAVSAAIARDSAVRAEQAGIETLWAHYEALSPREKQVMAFVASGLMNKQIAFELKLSEITVKIHRGNVCERWKRARWRISSKWPKR